MLVFPMELMWGIVRSTNAAIDENKRRIMSKAIIFTTNTYEGKMGESSEQSKQE